MSEAPGAGQEPELLYDVRDGVAWLTFNRPKTRNALTFPMYARLEEICRAIETDRSITAMVITGAGEKAFAAGTDISQFQAFESADDALAYERRIDQVLTALEKCRVPTIAAISGACTGGGAAIAACCDLRLGTQTAQFGFPIARTLGNCLSMNSIARLSALIGPARVKDIIFTARLVGAEEAHGVGLLQEVVADHATLLGRAEQLARLVSGHAPLTLRATKEALRRLQDKDTGHDDLDLVLMCYMSEDFKEGIDAFLNKRSPNWRGR